MANDEPVDIGRSLVLGVLKGYWEAGSNDRSQITKVEWARQEDNGNMALRAHLEQGDVYEVTARRVEEKR